MPDAGTRRGERVASETRPLGERGFVVIATHNRAESLERTLAELRKLPDPPPVLVVDDASTDGTRQIVARELPDVELLVRERQEGPVEALAAD